MTLISLNKTNDIKTQSLNLNKDQQTNNMTQSTNKLLNKLFTYCIVLFVFFYSYLTSHYFSTSSSNNLFTFLTQNKRSFPTVDYDKVVFNDFVHVLTCIQGCCS